MALQEDNLRLLDENQKALVRPSVTSQAKQAEVEEKVLDEPRDENVRFNSSSPYDATFDRTVCCGGCPDVFPDDECGTYS